MSIIKIFFLKIFIISIEKIYSFYLFKKIIRKSIKISMLHPGVLALIYYFAKYTNGYVLEIGSYIGGSTSVIAHARKNHKNTFISIEMGGINNHPEIPSQNIFKDLKSNLIKLDLINYVKLLNGFSNDANIINNVKSLVGNKKISLLVIDADGNVERDIENYKHLLQDNCIIILDDYNTPELIKVLPTKTYTDKAVKEKSITKLAIVKWGTFIGLYNK
tara:strand:+ start:94 stop:747 length:654 start_codon:yes stop_codon:yes gene_type:complete